MFPLVLALALSSPALAQECPSEHPVQVQIRCAVELSGTAGHTRKLEASTPSAPLSMQAVGQSARLTFGDHTLDASLACMDSAYTFEVKLTRKPRTQVPVHVAMLRDLGLDRRAGEPPITLVSYAYFEPAVEVDGAKFTRLDYTCSIGTTKPDQRRE